MPATPPTVRGSADSPLSRAPVSLAERCRSSRDLPGRLLHYGAEISSFPHGCYTLTYEYLEGMSPHLGLLIVRAVRHLRDLNIMRASCAPLRTFTASPISAGLSFCTTPDRPNVTTLPKEEPCFTDPALNATSPSRAERLPSSAPIVAVLEPLVNATRRSSPPHVLQGSADE